MPKKEGYVQVPVCELHGLAVSSLRRANVPPEEAEIIAESLVEADQRGVYTHGCVCLPRYIGLMNGGHMRAAAEYRVLRQTDAIAVWDGMRSSGQVLGNWAMKEAMRHARTHGIGAVAVKGSNHFGAGAYYAQLAQKEGMIGIAMSTGSSTMAPWGGADRLIGNNPVAVAVPAEKHVPVVLDMAQSVVSSAAGVTLSEASLDISGIVTDLEVRLMAMDLGPLFGLWFQTLFVGVCMWALSICIFIVVYGRMIEIYLVTSIAPIPMATMMNREWGQTGQNYLRSLLALGFQAFLIVVCVAIYAALVGNITASDNISYAIWTCMGYTVLLCFTLFKTGSMAKSIFHAH